MSQIEEVKESVVRNESPLAAEGSPIAPIERHQQEHVIRDANGTERREVITQDVGAERQFRFAKAMSVYWLGVMVVLGLIGLRVLLKMIAANPNSPFAALVYGLTNLFVWPFFGLTATPTSGGSVFEASSVIAIIVYALFSLVIAKLVRILVSRGDTRSVTVYTRDANP